MITEGTQNFHVRCNAGVSGAFDAGSERLSVAVGQSISRDGNEQVWEFVLVLSDFRHGFLTTRVFLCHPDWDEPMEIAAVQSDLEKIKVQVAESQPPMR